MKTQEKMHEESMFCMYVFILLEVPLYYMMDNVL